MSSRTTMYKRARISAMKRKPSRSLSRPTTRRALFPKRSYALASPAVGLGTSCRTVLRTSFFANCTSNAAGVFNGFLRPGSCFDPCGDQAAIQPQMFDQFAAAYNRYKVNSATVRLTITGAVGINGVVWHCAAYPAIDPGVLATYQAAASQQYAKTISGGYQLDQIGASIYGIGNAGKSMTFKLNHDAVVGAKSDTWDIGALVTGDPPALQHMVLPFFFQGSNAGTHSFVIEVDIWQNVTFSQKKNTVDA